MSTGPGRPALPDGEALTETLEIRVTPAAKARLQEAAALMGTTLSDAGRGALEEWYGDFHERRLFDRRQRSQRVSTERRRGGDRRFLSGQQSATT